MKTALQLRRVCHATSGYLLPRESGGEEGAGPEEVARGGGCGGEGGGGARCKAAEPAAPGRVLQPAGHPVPADQQRRGQVDRRHGRRGLRAGPRAGQRDGPHLPQDHRRRSGS